MKDNIMKLPMIPVRSMVVFPDTIFSFDIARDKSIKALEESMKEEQLIFLTSQIDNEIELPTMEEIYKIGTVCKIKQLLKLPGNVVRVLSEGLYRGEFLKQIGDKDKYTVEIRVLNDFESNYDAETYAFKRSILDITEAYAAFNSKFTDEVINTITDSNNLHKLVNIVSHTSNFEINDKQELLYTINIKKRLKKLYSVLIKEIEISELEDDIEKKLKTKLDKNQREYYLREKIRVISKELGDDEEYSELIENYKEQLNKLEIDSSIKEKIKNEINRLNRISSNTQEGSVIRTYLDTFFSLPWNKSTKDNLDIKKIRKVLDDDHFSLEKVKERLIEYVAVKKLNDNLRGPILCLVGPPGTGKTSIASSLARAMNRKFSRIALGGVRDEAEIRGHRRTYVGAIPGRIINSIREVKSSNPLILFDEIDKLGADYKGDPSSALLEVLDPEQNSTFTDHYLELPFDLSKVLFITTANSISTIPRPLLDRMEVIELGSYLDEEKVKIGKKFLLKKIQTENGLEKNFIKINDVLLKDIINNYTRESGVRELKRVLEKLARKIAVIKTTEQDISEYKISSSNIEILIGKPRYKNRASKKVAQVGVVTGLAWTQVGGDTLSIEVNILEGSGKLELTGLLGNVMKESAVTGLSYIRSKYKELDLDESFYKNKDIHIHIPEGAIPKDGPSAGVTMTTCMISALTNMPVIGNLAMTGEITLRGRVLAVGGIKEKLVAAYRDGITNIIIPSENKSDIDEIPASVLDKLTINYANNIEDILELAFEK
ncbi:MAG: endopeptidase La [Filifactoraceae bacterium]